MQTMILTPFFEVASVGESKSGNKNFLTLFMTKCCSFLSEKGNKKASNMFIGNGNVAMKITSSMSWHGVGEAARKSTQVSSSPLIDHLISLQ